MAARVQLGLLIVLLLSGCGKATSDPNSHALFSSPTDSVSDWSLSSVAGRNVDPAESVVLRIHPMGSVIPLSATPDCSGVVHAIPVTQTNLGFVDHRDPRCHVEFPAVVEWRRSQIRRALMTQSSFMVQNSLLNLYAREGTLVFVRVTSQSSEK